MSQNDKMKARFSWIEASMRYAGYFDKISYREFFKVSDATLSIDQAKFVLNFNQHLEIGDVLRISCGKITASRPLPKAWIFEQISVSEWLSSAPFAPIVRLENQTESFPSSDIWLPAIRDGRPLSIETTEGVSFSFSPHLIFMLFGRAYARGWSDRLHDFSFVSLDDVSHLEIQNGKSQIWTAEHDTGWLQHDLWEIALEPGPIRSLVLALLGNTTGVLRSPPPVIALISRKIRELSDLPDDVEVFNRKADCTLHDLA